MAQDGDMGTLDGAMVGLHELYSAMRRAGFTRGDALTIIAKMAAEGMQNTADSERDVDER